MKIVLFLLVVLAVFVIYVATKSPEYLVFREVSISASPEKIFSFFNSARKTELWMPWSAMDSQMKMSYAGPESGVGSKALWDSPGKMGTGSSTISESIANRSVKVDLEYMKPFQMHQVAELSITPSGSQSIVRWSVSGKNNFIGKAISLVMNCDKMIGGSFEQGLAKLKTLAEA